MYTNGWKISFIAQFHLQVSLKCIYTESDVIQTSKNIDDVPSVTEWLGVT